jgi:hypothetical protein
MERKFSLIATLSALLCGCGALSQPMSSGEFREAVKGSSFATVETFDADRQYDQVVEALRSRADTCLAVVATSSGPVFQGNTMVTEHSRAAYKPTISATRERLELAVQVDFGEHTMIQKVPPGGMYILVADAIPAGKGTKLTIYRGKVGKATEIGGAIRQWSTGQSSACPKLSG